MDTTSASFYTSIADIFSVKLLLSNRQPITGFGLNAKLAPLPSGRGQLINKNSTKSWQFHAMIRYRWARHIFTSQAQRGGWITLLPTQAFQHIFSPTLLSTFNIAKFRKNTIVVNLGFCVKKNKNSWA
jgi:hypothetical protein